MTTPSSSASLAHLTENEQLFLTEERYPLDKYFPILALGTGSHGSVWLSLPLQEYTAALADPNSTTFASLTSKLVAVKVFPSSDQYLEDLVQREAAALHRIRDAVDQHGYTASAFALLLDEGEDWLVMDAIFPSVNLGYCLVLDIPPTVMLGYLLEVTAVFAFLLETCDPAITHDDMHDGNVLVSSSKTGETDRAPVTVIDFNTLAEPYFTPAMQDDHVRVQWSKLGQIFEDELQTCMGITQHFEAMKGVHLDEGYSAGAMRQMLQTVLERVAPSEKPEEVRAYEARLGGVLAAQEEKLLRAFRKAKLLPET